MIHLPPLIAIVLLLSALTSLIYETFPTHRCNLFAE